MTEGHLQKKGEKIPIYIDDSWDDITLGKFIEINAQEEPKDSKMFSILTGLDEEIIRQCSHTTVRGVLGQIESLLDPNTLEELTPLDRFTFEEKEYIGSDLTKASYGEWIDLESELDALNEGKIERLPYLLAITFRPEGQEYSWDKARNMAKQFKRMPITTAYRLRAFFLTREIQSLRDSLSSSAQTNQQKTNSPIKQDTETSEKSGERSWLSRVLQKITRN